MGLAARISKRMVMVGKGVAYLLFLATAVLVILEAGVRLFMPQVLHRDVPKLWLPDDTIGWRHQPNQRLVANSGERDVEICTNAQGDRVHCSKTPKSNCENRVLVIGDSFVEALAIPFEQTVWSLLEEEVDACFEVTGVGGYVPAQYLQTIKEKLEKPGADYKAIIVAIFVNDFFLGALDMPAATAVQGAGPMRLLPDGLSLSELRTWFYPYNQVIESHSHAYVALRYAVRRLQDPADVGIFGIRPTLLKSVTTEEIVAPIRDAFKTLHRNLEQQGITLILSVIPDRNRVLDPDGARLRGAFPVLADDIDMTILTRLFVEPMKLTLGINVVDLYPRFVEVADKSYWGTQDMHFSPKGHRLWYEIMLPATTQALSSIEGDSP